MVGRTISQTVWVMTVTTAGQMASHTVGRTEGAMDDQRESIQNQAEALMQNAMADACLSYGALLSTGTWQPHAERRLSIDDGRTLVILHDEREAPYCVDGDTTLVSITDEGDLALCVWAVPKPDSNVAGIGIDLASTCDFAGDRGARFNHLLFSEHEQDFVRNNYGEQPELGYAYTFSAKEAAFKSLAAPLRSWYAKHTEELVFEVREFELADAAHARGTLRHACAQAAMDAMGIRTIELFHTAAPSIAAVLTLAVART